ncbi:MAG: hypothetical protein WAO02_06655 [Verrucomicrobiia bacterium]
MNLWPAGPLSHARAWACLLTNLFATPGLGTLMARRFFAGTGQLLLGLAGFVLIVGWMFEWCRQVFLQQLGEPVPPGSFGWMGKWGLIFFVAAWLWSLVTSLSLLRLAKTDESARPKPVPPRLAGSPGQPPKLS